MSITHLFFDIGGVLGTNAWGRGQRAAAVTEFGLDAAELAERHEEAVAVWESGGMSIDEYLDSTVFHRPRAFSREDFRAFMMRQSVPFPETIAVARDLAGTGRYRMMTLNNESAELNVYRLRLFGLREIFVAFYSSCWLGMLKPSRHMYQRALDLSQAEPADAVFIDDRERNLDAPRGLGMHTIRYQDVAQLRRDLVTLGVAT